MTDQQPPHEPAGSASSSTFSDRHRSKLIPLAAGVGAGLVLRLAFRGQPGEAYATMLGSFMYLAPMIVGAVTVYVAERIERRTWGYYLAAAFIANTFFVLGALLILIEGLICAIVIIPMFGVLAMLGGLLAGALCRLLMKPERPLYGLLLAPFALGAVEPPPTAERINAVERSVLIDASPERVWRTIQSAEDIRPHEVDSAWLYRIGIPLPLAGVTREERGERVRTITMGKSVYFDQVVTEWVPERLMAVKHRYYADSFPPYAMDEHVVLGGHYFDVNRTSYVLTPQGRRTELTIRLEYRVSTPFNWYADPFAYALFADFERVILDFYKRRSEAPERS
jgi:hypothetical protein